VAAVEPLIRADPGRAGAPALPSQAQHAVVRTSLVNRLCAATEVSLATIIAPAGYGKTTLLAQWAERDSRRTVGVVCEPGADPVETVELLGPLVEESGLLVLVDDVHVLRSREALDALARVLGRVGARTTLALAGRRLPQLPLARLRAEGRLVEIGMDELAFGRRDSATLLRRAGVLLSQEDAAALARRFEGWPAALFLAALSIRGGTSPDGAGGEDPFVADYLEVECLGTLSPIQRDFAQQISVLEEPTPEDCESLLDHGYDSRKHLDSLERAGVITQVDRYHHRYRFPRIVRELLSGELERHEPERARTLHRLAAVHAGDRGSTREALEHAATAEDLEQVAQLAARLALPACGRDRLDELEPWLELLHDELDVAPPIPPDLALAAWWLYALRGATEDAQRWADAAIRNLGGDDPRLRVLQALRCRDGVDQMLDDTSAALAVLPAGHPWRPAAVLARGVALLLTGDAARAERDLIESIELAAASGSSTLRIVGLCLRALHAMAENADADADAFVAEVESLAGDEPPADSLVALLLAAVEARNLARHGDHAEAAARVERAEPLLAHANYAVPWLAAVALLELVQVRVTVADADGARLLLRRVADLFRVRPRLGVLVQRTAELDARTRALAEPGGRRASSLTPAELRLLPLLATHLSFREIGERLYISRNTVKTQAIAVYRKFGVTSRSSAISRAVALGLIDDTAITTNGPFRSGERSAEP
jgi:LuxR family transcriptional regulator, maltose regulon positive regulatory protein